MGSNTDDLKGNLKESAGRLTGDDELKDEGRGDQAAAEVKDKIEGAKDLAEDAVDKVRGKD
jgi:uncharacterized protein YjbJ (UPF0337 family)